MKKLTYVTAMLLCAGVASAAIIQPTAVISEEYVFNSAADTINNDRMITPVNGGDSLASALLAVHEFGGTYNGSYVSTDPGGYPSDFFASLPGGDTDVDIVLDLTGGGDTPVGTILLWNYENYGGGPERGANQLRALDVRINTEAQGSGAFDGPAIPITVLPVQDADTDPLNDLGGINSAQAFPLGALSGRYVQLSLTDNYYALQGITAGGDRVGLGEVRFDTDVVPEPATLSLMAVFGGVVLLLRRKRVA